MDAQSLKMDERGEFGLYTRMADFPAGEYPAYLAEGVGGVCTSGSAVLRVFSTEAKLTPGVIVILLPWQLVSLKEASTDFGMTFFCVSQDMFTDTLSSLWRLTPEFFFIHAQAFRLRADRENSGASSTSAICFRSGRNIRPRTAGSRSCNCCAYFYWDVYTVYVDDPRAGRLNYSRKEELAFRFLRLIIEEHAPNMELASYAAKLGVSAKYLTSLIRHMSGHSAREWIVYYTLLEIKSLLRESSLDLKTIAARANFPDQSSLARFFRRYTGITPLQYRKTIHF